jgi:ubiquinone/menaquinone biosynthesis C-methylase UbiE
VSTGQPDRPTEPAPAPGSIATPTAEERSAAAAVLRLISGIHISRAVYALAALGIADLLAGGPKTSAELAAATGAHEPSLYRVLRLLASLEVLVERERRSFGLTVLGDRLRTDAPASMHAWAMLVDALGGVAAFDPFIETLRSGTPGVQLAHGMSIFELVSRRPRSAAGFQAAMSERTAAVAASVATCYEFGGMSTVVDIGGGKGTLLAAILDANPQLRGVLFDRPGVISEARDVLRAAGVADRCEVVGGDFFESIPPGADAYIMANVLHDWGDAHAVHILGNVRRVMSRSARLLVVERLLPTDPAEAVPVLLSDINMLVFTGGLERTNAEYEALLTQADIELRRVQPVAPPYGVLEGLAR